MKKLLTLFLLFLSIALFAKAAASASWKITQKIVAKSDVSACFITQQCRTMSYAGYEASFKKDHFEGKIFPKYNFESLTNYYPVNFPSIETEVSYTF